MSWQLVDANLRRAMWTFSLATESGEVREMPGVTLVSSGIDFGAFNSAMLSSPVVGGEAELDRRLAIAAVHFTMRRIGWSFWLSQSLLDKDLARRAGDVFAARGLRLLLDAPAMVTETLAPPVRELPGLDFRRVDSVATRTEFAYVTSVAFNLPFAVSQAVYGADLLWRGDYRGWIGYLDGKAVTTAATLEAGGALGVYSVATLPEHRRRGYGEAVTRHALEMARAQGGNGPLILQSTPAGRPLYQRMGFRTVSRVAIYIP